MYSFAPGRMLREGCDCSRPVAMRRSPRLFELGVCDRQDGSDMPTICIANERLADEKDIVLRRFAWKAARENDRDENLHDVVRDRGYVKLRHVGFEMPCAFVVFLEPSGDRIASSGFDATRKPEHAGRIPKHGFHIVRIMRILRSH